MNHYFAWIFGAMTVLFAGQTSAQEYPDSGSSTKGNHFLLEAPVDGFVPATVTEPSQISLAGNRRCAPAMSEYTINHRGDQRTWVQFHLVAQTEVHVDGCSDATKLVGQHVVYSIENAKLDAVRTKARSVMFGALIVPFKFKLGSDKKLSSSVTIAPYLGFAPYRFQGFGMQGNIVISAGPALVPVASADGKSTDSKAAFSAAFGTTLSSLKNAKFNAGILLGYDYLSKSDRVNDPKAGKWWFSLWVGSK